jgi:hypothetical protein
MFKKIKKYYSIDQTERKILNRTFVWLMYAFILVRFIPLRWFNSLLGEFNKETEIKLDDKQIQLINLFRKNLKRLKKVLPWQVKCFEEAIAGKKVLNIFDIKTTLFLGVTKEGEQNLKAHAWLKIGDQFITGEQGHQNYTVVGFYS